MRRREALVRVALATCVMVAPGLAYGQAPPGAMPPGHPDVRNGHVASGAPGTPVPADEDGDEAPLPPGHPETAGGRGAAPQGGAPGIFEPPADTETEDAALPRGTIVVELLDADNNPLPGVQTSLGILHQSVAKGESREHKMATSDAKGLARFEGLETGGGVAYRVTVGRDGATFGALPFQLPETKGMHVGLHVYAVSRDLQEAMVVMQGIFFVEVKDDRIQIEQVYSVFNVGKVAWVADGVLLKLPERFTALSAQQSMSDQGVDSVDKVGGRLHGTFAPGRHEVSFRWQLPYGGEKDVEFDLGLAPHVAVMRAMAGAAGGVKFSVTGFPEPEAKNDNQGQRILVTEKQARRDEPWTSLHVKLSGLPSAGPGRFVASGLAALGVVTGLFFAFGGIGKPARGGNTKNRRAELLAELLSLENARKSGDVGPKTYERARREIVDAIARTLDESVGAARRA